MEYGGQCVMTSGMKEMLQLFAGSWGSVTEVHVTINNWTSMSLATWTILTDGVAVPFAQFGSGVRLIHLDDVQCDGSELRLANCSHLGVGVHNCQYSGDAGVICRSGYNAIIITLILYTKEWMVNRCCLNFYQPVEIGCLSHLVTNHTYMECDL